MTPEIIASQLKGGRVYLTLGSVQQIQWLCQIIDLPVETLYNPTTNQFRSLITPQLFSGRRAVIIYYENLVGSGDVNVKAKSVNYGCVKNNGNYVIPNDQFLEIDEELFIFITLINPATSVVEHKKVGSLSGGLFEELDLTQLQFTPEGDQQYPFSTLKRRAYADVYGVDDTYDIDYQKTEDCKDVIEMLLRPEACRLWYDISKADLNYMFLVKVNERLSGKSYPILLMSARAWCLESYLSPIISRIVDNPSAYQHWLSRFATWVYLSTNVWCEPGREGLRLYKPRSKVQPYWFFKPSTKAKLNFVIMVDDYITMM